MCRKLTLLVSFVLLVGLVSSVFGQPVPVWHNTLEDLASSTIDGGAAYGVHRRFPQG